MVEVVQVIGDSRLNLQQIRGVSNLDALCQKSRKFLLYQRSCFLIGVHSAGCLATLPARVKASPYFAINLFGFLIHGLLDDKGHLIHEVSLRLLCPQGHGRHSRREIVVVHSGIR